MECTQRLEWTQELGSTMLEKTCPEQVGFLGICGSQYPIIKGPNKIGRDPQTCNVVLNLNSISRQHAVINVLSHNQYMFMDLGSANKTKLNGKTLQPYISYSLNNGDTVQFGDIFGIYRLLEDDDDLPMTQAIDIPETPVVIKHMSKLINAPCTTVPESPDISDKEESIIGASQTKKVHQFKSPNNRFLKTSGKTITIQPIGSNRIDNVYWNSEKKSRSLDLSLDRSDNFNESTSSDIKTTSIDNKKDIYEMETQFPDANAVVESIYTANTQVSTENFDSPTINSLPTQIPVPINDNLPKVCKISDQVEMKCNLYTANKENILNIKKTQTVHNAETQNIFDAETQNIFQAETQKEFNLETQPISKDISKIKSSVESQDNINKNTTSLSSDEEILFDELESQNVLEEFESQPILPQEFMSTNKNETILDHCLNNNKEKSVSPKPKQRVIRIQSDSSTDCEDIDIQLTQNVPVKLDKDEDLTDCEDNMDPLNNLKITVANAVNNIDDVNSKDDLDGIDTGGKKSITINRNKENTNIDFENMPTQVLDSVKPATSIPEDENFEDMPTQVLKDRTFEEMLTQIISESISTKPSKDKSATKEIKVPQEITSPFKIPIQSPLKIKRKDIPQITLPKNNSLNMISKLYNNKDDKYYESTQKIFDDLCSQKQNEILESNDSNDDVEIVPCSLEEVVISDKFRHITEELSPCQNMLSEKKSSDRNCTNSNEKVSEYIANLSTEQIRDIVVGEPMNQKQQKRVSDPSDFEETPTKVKPLKLIETDLPSSQEIKANVKSFSKQAMTTFSSESEPENNTDECTPIVYRKKKRTKKKIDNASTDLTKTFEVLPSRVIIRQRKPTMKLLANNTAVILKSKFLSDQDSEIDSEIIEENLTRLRSKINSNISNKKENLSIDKSISKSNRIKKETKDKNHTKETASKSYKPEEKSNEKNTRDRRRRDKIDSNKTKQNIDHKEISLIEKKNDEKNKKEIEKIVNQVGNNKATSKNNKGNRRHNTRSEGRKDGKEKDKTSDIERDSIEKKQMPEPMEIRRSKRQRMAKEKVVKEIEKPKSILKPSKSFNQDQSTIYNISTSSTDSTKSLKRRIRGEADVSTSKKARKEISTNNHSLRSTPARNVKTTILKVLFTAFPEPIIKEVTVKLQKIGAVVVSDVLSCDVLVSQSIKRTFKLLCAVSLGKPIVGPNWIQACHDANMIVDPWLYLLKDESAEKRFKFSLHRTLVGKRNFLEGFHVSCTPNVKPGAAELKLIVECSGGRWGEGAAGAWACVASVADRAPAAAARARGAALVSAEFVLSGVLQQRRDLHAYLLNV